MLFVSSSFSFGLLKSYKMPCTVESASLEPKYGDKFITGGEDMWIRLFDFQTGEEISKFSLIIKRKKAEKVSWGSDKCSNSRSNMRYCLVQISFVTPLEVDILILGWIV